MGENTEKKEIASALNNSWSAFVFEGKKRIGTDTNGLPVATTMTDRM